MGVYEDLGLRPIINLHPFGTRLGGPMMDQEVLDAMMAASQQSVPMDQRQATASRIIADVTGAEAGYVTAGAASSLTLATAACIAGLDVKLMDLLPNTSGIPNEVIIAREQRSGYDHAIRAAGARLVEVGMNEILAGAGVRTTKAWGYEAAISQNTVAIAYFYRLRVTPTLEKVINIGNKYKIPVIVDAAAQLPPVENLRKFISMGADLVTFSGGKAICGPQSTGILCGQSDLISSVALQHLDLDERYETWNPPQSLIPRDRLLGIPRHGIGRGFKVTKEEIVALLTALRRFTSNLCIQRAERCSFLLQLIAKEIQNIPNTNIELKNPDNNEEAPVLRIKLNEKNLGLSAFEVSHRLINGDPSVYVDEALLHEGKTRIKCSSGGQLGRGSSRL